MADSANTASFTSIECPSLACLSESADFLADVRKGLGRRPKYLDCKYLYDRRGSALFDQICELEAYYPMRVESSIMQRHAAEMAECLGGDAVLVELGSGSSLKTRLLLSHLKRPEAYLPVDISEQHLLDTSTKLREEYPHLEICPVVADFTSGFDLPERYQHDRTSVYFPGSTIGNLLPAAAVGLLSNTAEICGREGGLLIGFDLVKDVSVLHRAYNDELGITAEFNLNLLKRINRELDADFAEDQFQHVAFFNPVDSRIEIYIESLIDQSVSIGDWGVDFAAGERILTEYSHKYTIEGFTGLARRSGLRVRKVWTDPAEYFAVMLLASA